MKQLIALVSTICVLVVAIAFSCSKPEKETAVALPMVKEPASDDAVYNPKLQEWTELMIERSSVGKRKPEPKPEPNAAMNATAQSMARILLRTKEKKGEKARLEEIKLQQMLELQKHRFQNPK